MSEKPVWPRQCSPEDVRAARIIQDLGETSKSLFSPPYSPVEIEVAEVTSKGTEDSFLDTEAALREHLSIHHTPNPPQSRTPWRSSFFLLEPAYSWSHLPITQDGMLSLLTALDVFPNIHRYLTAFGRKSFPKDEGFAGFDSATILDRVGTWTSFGNAIYPIYSHKLDTDIECCGLESCYLLKYVGKRDGATPGTNPWSIRHALIYQKVSREATRVSHILIRVPENVKQQLGSHLLRDDGNVMEFAQDWTHIHTACFSSVDRDLREFINYLDEEITKVFERVIMSGLSPTELNEFDSVQRSTKDFKTLQYLSDQARRLINAITLNMETIKCFQKQIGHLSSLGSWVSARPDSLESLYRVLDRTQQEHHFSLKNASAVLERAKATSEQLRDAATLRNSEINKVNAEMANRNTLAIAQLSEKSEREAHVVKTLTVLALVFVPAGFVADFLQMGYITISQEDPMRLAATADLKIYAALAIPLIGVTMLIYGVIEMMQKIRARESQKQTVAQSAKQRKT
ncbi:hypothetical protein FDECE_10086 [Fusarium decemcellulare]|nr:hypothetical protein FDECE_10086 [Fusarium decemcellulare]